MKAISEGEILASEMPGESIALERYEDLREYFGDAKAVLNNREEFKKWLERVQDNVNKADALYDEMEKIEKVKEFLEITAHFNGVVKADYILKLMRGAEDD